MGAHESKNKKDRRKNEVLIKDSNIRPINSCLYDVCPSICKIIFSNTIGTGFFIKLYKSDKPLFLLMTNEHIITKDMIKKKEEIEVYYNNQKKRVKITLDSDKRYIRRYNYINIDCTIVEIVKEDNINEDYFLLPNIDFKDYNYKKLKNKHIYIVQFPLGKDICYSNGEITNIDKYEFTHKASTEPGSSGSPIFLDKTTKVIGIHKASDNDKKENYGDFIFPIINKLKKKKNMNKYNKNVEKETNKQNELKIIIKLNLSDKYYYLRFTVFGEEFVKNNNEKCKIIVNGVENFELSQLCVDNKDENINNFLLKNSSDELEIILKETKTITNMDNMFHFYFCDIISIDFKNWDTSKVISMKGMFRYCRNIKIIKGISTLNTSNVRDMSYMFVGCNNIPDISNWDVSNVINMNHMFEDCNDVPFISNWIASKIEDTSYMFSGRNNIPDISERTTSNAKNTKGFFTNHLLYHHHQIFQIGISKTQKIYQICLMDVNH